LSPASHQDFGNTKLGKEKIGSIEEVKIKCTINAIFNLKKKKKKKKKKNRNEEKEERREEEERGRRPFQQHKEPLDKRFHPFEVEWQK